MAGDRPHPRASRWETLGAWLRLWTPPRDVEVPPFPRRAGALAALGLAALAALVVLVIAPAIDDARDEREARDRRAAEARFAERNRRLRVEQRPRFGRAAPPPAGAPAARRRGARRDLVARLERHVTADARARFAAGRLDARARATDCRPFPVTLDRRRPEDDLDRRRAGYECVASVRDIVRGGDDGDRRAGTIGIPFRAVVDFDRFTYAFCKIAPIPGERLLPDPRRVVALPSVCRAPD